MGQFTQLDPIGMSGGLNLYGYANSDPVNFRDPSGLMPDSLPDEIIQALAALCEQIGGCGDVTIFVVGDDGVPNPFDRFILDQVERTGRPVTIGETIYFFRTPSVTTSSLNRVAHELWHVHQFRQYNEWMSRTDAFNAYLGAGMFEQLRNALHDRFGIGSDPYRGPSRFGLGFEWDAVQASCRYAYYAPRCG